MSSYRRDCDKVLLLILKIELIHLSYYFQPPPNKVVISARIIHEVEMIYFGYPKWSKWSKSFRLLEVKVAKVEMTSYHMIFHIYKNFKKTKWTISVNIAPFLMKQLPFDSSWLDGSNKLYFIDFGSAILEIIAIELSAEIVIL